MGRLAPILAACSRQWPAIGSDECLTDALFGPKIRGCFQHLRGYHVANIKSAKKRARQGEKRRQHNMALRSKLRTHIKNVVKACEAGDSGDAAAKYTLAVPVIDGMVSKGIIHKNKAARHKSRLNKMVKAVA